MTKKPTRPRPKALAAGQTSLPAALPTPTETSPDTAPKRKTKALLRAKLDARAGATVPSIMAATGWQAHTMRAALSGLRKSGCVLDRRTGAEGTVYAIVHADRLGLPAGCDELSGASVTLHSAKHVTSDGGEDVAPPDDASGRVEIARSAPVEAAASSTSTTEIEPRS